MKSFEVVQIAFMSAGFVIALLTLIVAIINLKTN
jgi:Putative Holin-like Toxin (Hol-Tox)